MDFATLIGLIAGCGLIIWAILGKSELGPFLDGGSVALVIGGAVSAVFIGFPMSKLASFIRVVRKCFFWRSQDPRKLIADMVRYAEVARRDGILALENMTADITDPFIVTGVQMAVDGTDPELIEGILMNELEGMEQRHADGKAILDAMGKYAPAFGMVGTLVGLVIMLGKMNDPSAIGPAMAIALLTTLYGSLLANLVMLPMADKLAIRSREESLLKMIVIRGVMAIQSGDNPRIVEQKLRTFLPQTLRSKDQRRAA
jgi:chemotaxis protein MotA